MTVWYWPNVDVVFLVTKTMSGHRVHSFDGDHWHYSVSDLRSLGCVLLGGYK